MPAEALAKRLAGGRFRVKSNVELETANRFAAELERLGAVVSVVDAATGQPVRQPPPAVKPAPLSFEETLTPPPEAPPTSMPAPSPSPLSSGLAAAGAAATAPATSAGSPDGFESGLAAAFSGGQAQTDMGGAFSGDSESFSLATIDGDEDQPPPVAAVADSAAPAGMAEDMFRPPDEGEPIDVAIDVATPPPPAAPAGDEGLLNLFPEGEEPPGAAAIGQPRPQVPVGPESAMVDQAPAATALPKGNPVERGLSLLANNLGVRTAVGALLIVMLGFLPAHLVGALREGAYDTPREKIAQAHKIYTTTQVATNDELIELDNTVDKARQDQLAIMESTQTSIALTSGVVWILACGGLGFVWFRKIDWLRWA